jgi:DNA-directed RNA polymerase specialized sigma24 family protein
MVAIRATWCMVHNVTKTGATGWSERRRVRALSDSALVAAMRSGDEWAWAEFDARFRARLEQYARHVIGAPTSRWDECITEVIEDAALKLTSDAAAVPTHLTAYLIRAVRNRAVTLARSAARRHRHHVRASAVGEPEAVVWSLCSESALRASAGAAHDTVDGRPYEVASHARQRLGAALIAELSEEERCIVGWVAEAVPYRQIAAWIGASYDATSKRIWRLCRRLKQVAPIHASTFDAAERSELERFFRRVGAVHTPASAAAAGRRGGNER